MFTLGGAKLFKVICILCFLKSGEEEITARKWVWGEASCQANVNIHQEETGEQLKIALQESFAYVDTKCTQ